MTYINVGARLDTGSGAPPRITTKKALRDALRDNPGDVRFDNTHYPVADWQQKVYRADELPEGIKFSVCGPDPYTDRKWFATVQLKDGQPKVTT